MLILITSSVTRIEAVRTFMFLKILTADFGLSKIVEDQVTMKTVCGTPGYCGMFLYYLQFTGLICRFRNNFIFASLCIVKHKFLSLLDS